ncbi:hypothetical protein B0H17DRAFT_1129159 [Mycena rosella]|uniref:Uncharacterized protein n=1 Tax=Mycena rosella TaxID=1033263 RepID=A0AAD7DWC8_MYCRO|nr:hypothetical protein B0H17DRAFT_1129159 [Mycena rosella]
MDAINQYNGVSGAHRRRHNHQTGAGIVLDNEGPEESNGKGPSVEEELKNQIGADLAQNICHEPVKVAQYRLPFRTTGRSSLAPRLIARGYGILENDDCPEIEIIKPGTHGKEADCHHPLHDWFQRAVQWHKL